MKRVEFVALGQQWTDVEVRAHRFLDDVAHADRDAAKKVLDERYALLRELFQKSPLAINTTQTSFGEDGAWTALGYRLPQ